MSRALRLLTLIVAFAACTSTASAADTWTATGSLTLAVTRVDTTPPVITPVVTGTLGDNGWYRSDVKIAWTVADPDGPTSSCAPSTLTHDTVSATFRCTAKSAGGETTQSVTVKRDITPPVISLVGEDVHPNRILRKPPTTDTSYAFVASDSFSGIAADVKPACTLTDPAGKTTPIPSMGGALYSSGTGVCTIADRAGNVGSYAFSVGDGPFIRH
jgi:hypothetical protein